MAFTLSAHLHISQNRRKHWKRVFSEVKRYGNIILHRAHADIKADREKTYAGSAWFFLDPLLMAAVYMTVGMLLKHREEDFAVFVVVGSFIWQAFARSVPDMSASIIKAKSVITLVHIPKIIFPLSELLGTFIRSLIALGILIAGLNLTGHGMSWAYLSLPLLAFVLLLLCLGIGLPLAAVIPFVPDVREAVRAIMRMMGFISGIFFFPTDLTGWQLSAFWSNPMACMLRLFRMVLLEGLWPAWHLLGYVAAIGLAGTILGTWLTFRFDRHYSKALNR